MKKVLLLTTLLTALTAPLAMAEQTVSVGYSHGKVSNGDSLDGVNVKYRNEVNDQWGWIGSVTYMKGDKKGLRDTTTAAPDILANGKRDTKYYSIMAGPTFRVNDVVSVYGLMGLARTKSDVNADWLNHEGGNYVKRGTVSASHKKTALGYGLGAQINPTKNIAIDVAYEGAQSSNALGNKHMNAFSVGVGYRF